MENTISSKKEYDMKVAMVLENKISNDFEKMNFCVSEIFECESLGIIDRDAKMRIRNHIREKQDRLNLMIDAVSKWESIIRGPVSGPMSRKTKSPATLTDAEKALIKEAYNRYFPNFPI